MSFPDMNRCEVLLVTPGLDTGRTIARTEAATYAATARTETAAPVYTAIVRFSVDTSYLDDFLAALDSGMGGLELTLPGYDLFGIASEANLVQVVDAAAPRHIDRGLAYVFDVTFRWLEALP